MCIRDSKYYAAFIGMAALGHYLYLVTNQIMSLYLGYLFGGLITYFIAEMVINKTVWVFRYYKGFFIFALAALLFIGALKVDIIGFESRVPSLSNVKSFSFNSGSENQYNDQNNIFAISKFHQTIIDQKDYFEAFEQNNDRFNSRSVQIVYHLKNNRTVSRSYTVSQDHFENNLEMKKIFESNEHANIEHDVLFSNIKHDFIYLEPDFGKNEVKLLEPNEIKAFLEVVKKDILEESFESMMSDSASIATFELRGKEVHDDIYNYHHNRPYDYIRIKHTYKHTLNWLKQNDYYDLLITKAKDLKYVQVIHVSRTNESMYSVKAEPLPSIIPTTDANNLIITDLNQIQELIENHADYSNTNEYFQINFQLKNGQNYNGYISPDDAPKYITTHFKK